MAIDGGKIVSYLELDASNYQKAMATAEQEARLFAHQLSAIGDSNLAVQQRINEFSSGMMNVGARMTMAISAPLAAAGTFAAKAATDYESAFAGVRKTVDATEAEYAQLSQSLRQMSEEIPQSAASLAGIMEIAGQLGVGKSDLTAFTETIANLGVATNLSGEEAATMLAQYANIMQMPLSDIDRLGSVIVGLGNSCATTERDIAEMAQRLAGTGNLLGLNNAQVMGLSATMASLGINAEAGGSAMSRTLQAINAAVLSGGDELTRFAQAAGVSAQDFAQAWRGDPLAALDQLLAGVSRVNASGGDATGMLADLGLNDLTVVDTLLRLSGAQGQLAENVSLANTAWEENDALQEEASKRYETTESQLQLAKNSIQNAATDVGNVMLPWIGQAAEMVSGAAQAFSGLDSSIQGTIVTSAGALAALGPVTTMLGTAIKVLTNPVGLVAALGLLGTAGVVAFRQMRLEADRAALEERFGRVTLSAEEVEDAVSRLFDGQETARFQLVDDAAAQVQDAITGMRDAAGTLDTLLVKAEMGFEVDRVELRQSALALRDQAVEAIEAQSVQANLSVQALFGADDPEGTQLIANFNTYFGALEREASQLGSKLYQLIDQAMADGFIDAEESQAIQAAEKRMLDLMETQIGTDATAGLMGINAEAYGAELSLESMEALQERYNQQLAETNAQWQALADESKRWAAETAAQNPDDRYDQQWLADTYAQIDAQLAERMNQSTADAMSGYMTSFGNRWFEAYAPEIQQAGEMLPQIFAQASENASYYTDNLGLERGTQEWAQVWADSMQMNLRDAFSSAGWDNILTEDGRRQLQSLYENLVPTHEAVQELAARMGEEFPAELQSALDQMNIMQLLTADSFFAPGLFGDFFSDVDLSSAFADALSTTDTGAAAQTMMQPGLDAVSEAAPSFAAEGSNAAAGFAGALAAGQGAAAAAARQLVQAALNAARQAQDSHSPSREFGKLGRYATQGYTGEMDARAAYDAGYGLTAAAVEGARAGQDSHSPSKKFQAVAYDGANGYIIGTISSLPKVKKAAEDSTKAAADAARRAAQRAAAEAEAARQAAVLQGIRDTGAAALAADQREYDLRMAQLAEQTEAMMAFAGQHAVWYQDDAGTTQSQTVKDRYNALIDQENADYEVRKAELEGQQEQLEALNDYHQKRLEALKTQRDAEVAAIKEQYSLQKEMALDWLDNQADLLQQQLDDQRAAYDEEDYQQELAELKKQQRQSKSAREKRELQEQIDRMERDHALEAQEAALQETLAGYDALREAVQSGLIGLGDLTGNTAFGSLAFGTAGLGGLDTITAQALQNVLNSLDRSALAGGTEATVTAAQMAAALASAGTQSIAPVVVEREGRNYNIDMRGCVVRDESDIDLIVEKLEARIRAAGR